MARRSERTRRDLGRSAALTAWQRRALAVLKRHGVIEGLYLARGVAVAHHVGHRTSNDLHLFAPSTDIDIEHVRRRATTLLAAEVVDQTEVTLKLKVGRAMVDLVCYPYPTLSRPRPGPEGVPVAGVRDLAAMKLAAVAKRGVRRDYWDLYELLTRTRLTLLPYQVCPLLAGREPPPPRAR